MMDDGDNDKDEHMMMIMIISKMILMYDEYDNSECDDACMYVRI